MTREHFLVFLFAVGCGVVAGAKVFNELEVPEEHLAAFIAGDEDGVRAELIEEIETKVELGMARQVQLDETLEAAFPC